jgi:PKD repeat protein
MFCVGYCIFNAMTKFKFRTILLLLLMYSFINKNYAQTPTACFNAASGQSLPITQCGPFSVILNNCSSGTYDSVVWKAQISAQHNCTAPWGTSFITSKVATLLNTPTQFGIVADGSYKVCLYVFNRANGTVDSFCQCIAISYPFPVLNFVANDTFNCGNLNVSFTPLITLGTPPYGPLTWYYGDTGSDVTPSNTVVQHNYNCKSTVPPCYTVTMQATDVHGCSRVITKPCYINVPCAPTPNVSVIGGNRCIAPTTINFNISATPLIGNGIYKVWFPPLNSPPAAPLVGPTSNHHFSHLYNALGCNDLIIEVRDSISGCIGKDTLINAVCIQNSVIDSFVTHTPKICCGQTFHVKLATHNIPAAAGCNLFGQLIAKPVGGGSNILLPTLISNSNQNIYFPCGSISKPTVFNICFVGDSLNNNCTNCKYNFTNCLNITVYPTPVSSILQSKIDTVHCSTNHNFCFKADTLPMNKGCKYKWYINNPTGVPAAVGINFCTKFSFYGRERIFLEVCQDSSNGGCCSLSSIEISQSEPFGDFNITQTYPSCGSTCAFIQINQTVTDTLYPQQDSAYIYIFGDGTAPLHSNKDTITHCYTSSKDTCYDVKVIHIPYSMGGFVCSDTIVKTKAVVIGHHIIPVASYFPLEKCLEKRQACFTIYPVNNLKQSASNCGINCHWRFTQTGTNLTSGEVFSCDTTIVCISDVGQFDAHYSITDNGCIDTGYYVHNAVSVNGILGSLNFVYSCNYSSGYCVNIVPHFAIYPAAKTYTNVKIIVDPSPCGPVQTFTYQVLPGLQPPPINYCFCNPGSYKVTMISQNDSLNCPADTVIKFVAPTVYKAKINLVPITTKHEQCETKDWCFSSEHSYPGRPYNYDIMWDFGDGKKDTMFKGSVDTSLVRPCHHYDSCGTYYVKLKIKGTCTDSVIDTIVIHEIVPDITITALSANCNYCLIYHNNTKFCGSPLDSMILFFGNGTQKVYHTNWLVDTICYAIPPSNNARYMIFSKLAGCSKIGYISIPNIVGNQACFTPLPDTVVCQGSTINFNNCSGGLIKNSCWTVSSGSCKQNTSCLSTSNGNFNYLFNSLGYYFVNLEVSNSYGCIDDTCIRIHIANPVAAFSGPDTINCPGSFDTLINQSTGAYDHILVTVKSAPINYFATFLYSVNDPGGLPSKIGIPIGYPGNYNICWKITSVSGCVDSICKILHVEGPLGNLSCSNVFGCKGDTICCVLNTNSVNNPLIKYPDGYIEFLTHTTSGVYPFCHAYNVYGNQFVQAFIDDGQGCSYPLTDTVHIDGVTANFSWSPAQTDFCNKADVTMNDLTIKGLFPLDTANYKWIIYNSLGNVFAIYHHQYPHIVISTPGSYTMQLIVSTTFGCKDTITKPFVIIHQNPIAQFTSSPDTICINDCVTFTNTSINPDPLKKYTWYFDWNNPSPTSNSTNAVHCYANPGNYNVVLIDSSIYNCVDSSSKHLVVVVSGINININQDVDTICGTAGLVHFTGVASPSFGVTYQWIFGDGAISSITGVNAASHNYILPISKTDTCYQVSLIVRAISGCADTLIKQVCIAAIPKPFITIGNKASCSPLQTIFTDNTIGNIPLINYQINFGDGSANYNSTIPPNNYSKTYTNISHSKVATYTVIYSVTSNYNCTSNYTDSFKVFPIPVACVGNNDTVCPGVNSLIGCPPLPGYNYHWFKPKLPGIYKPNPFVPQPSISIYKSDTFSLAVSNQFGCVDTNKIIVKVRDLIVPDAGHDTTICYGDTIHLYAKGGESYIWKINGTNKVVSTSADVYIPVFDSTDFRLFIAGKCNNDTSTIIHVNIFKPKPYITINPNSANIFAGQHYVITPNTNGGLFQWRPNYFINCDTCHVVDVSPDVNTTYHVITTDLHGCSDSALFEIKVLCDNNNSLFIPNGFEPKVTAKYENRFFYIQGKGIKELEFIRIYNRWGSEVYSREHIPINKPDVGWDGTFDGKPCTCDIYMYQMQVICADGTIFPISGNMTLIR